MSPERCIGFLSSGIDIVLVLIADQLLVVGGKAESPNMIFFKTVIHSQHIGIRRVGVHRFTLDIVEVKVLIVIIIRNSGGGTNKMFRLSLLNLYTFKVVNFIQINIINIVLKVAIVFNSFVETGKVSVQVRTETSSRGQRLKTELQTIVDLVVFVLLHTLMKAS